MTALRGNLEWFGCLIGNKITKIITARFFKKSVNNNYGATSIGRQLGSDLQVRHSKSLYISAGYISMEYFFFKK